jgi:hypothetical protein
LLIAGEFVVGMLVMPAVAVAVALLALDLPFAGMSHLNFWSALLNGGAARCLQPMAFWYFDCAYFGVVFVDFDFETIPRRHRTTRSPPKGGGSDKNPSRHDPYSSCSFIILKVILLLESGAGFPFQ